MLNRRVFLDMGVWFKDPSLLMLYPEFTVSLMPSEPEWWLMQVQPCGYIKFDHWLELPGLGTPRIWGFCPTQIGGHRETSMTGKEQRRTLAIVPFQPQRYGHTGKYHWHPDHHLNQLQVHWRNTDDLSIPFYTCLVGLLLYFHKDDAWPLWAMHNLSYFLIEHTLPFLNMSPRDVACWWNMGSGTVPALVAAHLPQGTEMTSRTLPPLQESTPGCVHVSVGGHVCHVTRGCRRLDRSHGS